MTPRDFASDFERWAGDSTLPPRTPRQCCKLLASPSFCATYVGAHYGTRSPRIMFAGKDHGNADGSAPTPAARREGVVGYYRAGESAAARPWNPHYRGTISLTAQLLTLPCAPACAKRCAKENPENCALYQFAQANAVKCVELSKTSRRFQGQNVVAGCLPFVFDEIRVLEPHVLVLQSSETHFVWHFRNELSNHGRLIPLPDSEAVARCEWNQGGTTVIWFNRHPAYMPLARYLSQWVYPHVDLVRKASSEIVI